MGELVLNISKFIIILVTFFISLSAVAVINGGGRAFTNSDYNVQCGQQRKGIDVCPDGYEANQGFPAFPGAEGFGADSVGGRGGTVIKVTNLNDSGVGSFRAAVTAIGPRIVVFETSGIINLASQIFVTDPFITIAGETSPGGVLVTGYSFYLNTHDVIVRHMRFRVGSHRVTDGSNADPESLDSFGIWGDTVPGGANDAYNIILDHVSIGWGVDENMGISYRAHDISIQWSIIANALENAGHPKGEHSKGLLISQKFGGAANVSVSHTLFAHNRDRNPLISGDANNYADIRNNVIYNGYHGLSGVLVGVNAGANIIHNYIKAGPDTTAGAWEAGYFDGPPAFNNSVYTFGNIGPHRTDQGQEQWVLADDFRQQAASVNYQRATPWAEPNITTFISSESMGDCIASAAGATAPFLDSVDQATVTSYLTGTGTYTPNVSYPADFPVFTTPAVPADSDNDGIADSFETTVGFNVGVNDSAEDLDGDGYTNIEEYLHFLSASSYTRSAACQ